MVGSPAMEGRLVGDGGFRTLPGFGAYANYPRGSTGEGLQAVHMSAAALSAFEFSWRARGYFQNKSPTGVLRASDSRSHAR